MFQSFCVTCICDRRNLHVLTHSFPKRRSSELAACKDMMVANLGVDPATSLFVEDMARNLTPAKMLGRTTVWLDNSSESGHRDHLPDHVDFHATDIADWLDTLPSPWGIS